MGAIHSAGPANVLVIIVLDGFGSRGAIHNARPANVSVEIVLDDRALCIASLQCGYVRITAEIVKVESLKIVGDLGLFHGGESRLVRTVGHKRHQHTLHEII